MPWFFYYTANGRSSDKPKEKYAKPTKSTMNRICAAFDDIGNINMDFAGVPPFNYQMMLTAPFYEKDADIVQTFCDLDGMSMSTEIALAELPPHERSAIGLYDILADIIKETLIEKFGSVEYCYPFLVKSMFSGDNWKKSSHKKMFWRIYGETALHNIEENLKDYVVCPVCGTKIPRWADSHTCPKDSQGFISCVDCGKTFSRIGPRQCRCDECQKSHRDETKRLSAAKRREREKEYEKKCISSLRSRLMATSKTELSGPRMFSVSHGQRVEKDQDGK